MRIYDGAPRQDWEEVLRTIGGFVDNERMKEILLLELDGGFVLQGLGVAEAVSATDSFGALGKRTHDLDDARVGRMMDASASRRGSGVGDRPHPELTNYYELALRVIGAYVDSQRAGDVFLFEQDGSFVVRLYGANGSHQHSLAEFTREEILHMIEAAAQQRS